MNQNTWLPEDLTPDQQDARKRMQPTYPWADSKGRTITADEARERARTYIIRNNMLAEIVDSYLDSATSDEIMEWCVDPITGEFVDDD